MSDASCVSVQESIAWTRGLVRAEQDHVLSCESCRSFLEQITSLDAIMAGGTAVDVPDDFASRVMSRVLTAATTSPVDADRPGRTGLTWARLWDRKPMRLAAIHVGLAIGMTNLFRFVLSLLVPSTTWGGP